MITFLRLLGLACTLAALGALLLLIFGLGGFGLCIMDGQLTREERDEANGLNHPDGLEGKN
jgi:hypothetical protein